MYCDKNYTIKQLMNSREGSRGRHTSTNSRHTKVDIELPKISKTLFSNDSNATKLTLRTKYIEKIAWVNEPIDYEYLTNQEIENEYSTLRKDLHWLNQEVGKAIAKMETKSAKKIKVGGNSLAKMTELHDKEIENNQAILQRLRKENFQLQKRTSTLSTIKKDDIDEEIVQAKEKIQQLKNKIKQIKLHNKNVGDQIINTDQLFDKIRQLQQEREMNQRKKYKLHIKSDQVYESIAAVELKLEEINDGYQIAQNFFTEYNQKAQTQKSHKELQHKWRHQKYSLQVVEKRLETLNNTKQQKYHVILKNLEQEIERLGETDRKISQAEFQILESRRTIEEYENIIKSWEGLNNQPKELIEHPVFFTQFQVATNDEKKNGSETSIDKNINEQIIETQEKATEQKVLSEQKVTQQKIEAENHVTTQNQIEVEKKITQRIGINENEEQEEQDKDQVADLTDLDEKFKYRTGEHVNFRSHDVETEIGEKQEQIERESHQNDEDAELIDFNNKVKENKTKLTEKNKFNIDLSSIEDHLKKVDTSIQIHQNAIEKSKENFNENSD